MDRWVEIIRAEPATGGAWHQMPETGWGAVVAFAAGPGYARLCSGARPEVEVRHEVEGAEPAVSYEARTAEDDAIAAEFVQQHLRAVGIPPAPGTWWEALLPEDMDLDDLAERLDIACRLVVGETTGLEAAQREAEVIVSVVPRLLRERQV